MFVIQQQDSTSCPLRGAPSCLLVLTVFLVKLDQHISVLVNHLGKQARTGQDLLSGAGHMGTGQDGWHSVATHLVKSEVVQVQHSLQHEADTCEELNPTPQPRHTCRLGLGGFCCSSFQIKRQNCEWPHLVAHSSGQADKGC